MQWLRRQALDRSGFQRQQLSSLAFMGDCLFLDTCPRKCDLCIRVIRAERDAVETKREVDKYSDFRPDSQAKCDHKIYD